MSLLISAGKIGRDHSLYVPGALMAMSVLLYIFRQRDMFRRGIGPSAEHHLDGINVAAPENGVFIPRKGSSR